MATIRNPVGPRGGTQVYQLHATECSGRHAKQQMVDMIYGYFASQTVRAFVELEIADHLADSPLTANEVATLTGANSGAVARLMRTGIIYGLVEDQDGRYHSTAVLDTVRSTASGSLRGMVLGATANSHWVPWAALPHAVRTRESQDVATLGRPSFDYLAQNPLEAAEFTAYMESITELWAVDVAKGIDTTGVALAVDVGGANGALLRRLVDVNPNLHGIVFDRPDVAAAVAPVYAGGAEQGRIQAVGGDFFEAVPAGDLYLLKFVLHDWDDDRCVQILRRCRDAMRPGARVVILEMIIGEGNDPGFAALMDLNMLVVAGGRERSVAEYDDLLARSGWRRTSLSNHGSVQNVIEAIAHDCA